MIRSLRLVYMRGSSNFLVDRRKPTVQFKINELVDVINLKLPKRSIRVKGDSKISSKLLFISFITSKKSSPSAQIERQYKIK